IGPRLGDKARHAERRYFGPVRLGGGSTEAEHAHRCVAGQRDGQAGGTAAGHSLAALAVLFGGRLVLKPRSSSGAGTVLYTSARTCRGVGAGVTILATAVPATAPGTVVRPPPPARISARWSGSATGLRPVAARCSLELPLAMPAISLVSY